MEYFKHDINASEDDKICDLLANEGYELLGYYWRFIEYLYSRGGRVYKNKLNSVAWSLHMDIDKLAKMICGYDLFYEDDEFIYSKRVVVEIEEFEAVGKRMAEIGRKGGQASAKAKSEANAQPYAQAHGEANGQASAKADAQQNKREKIKEKKENKIKEREAHAREKNAFGKFKNVFLTDDQMSELKTQFPTSYEEKINRLSEYMYQSGKNYQDHYLMILKWAQEDVKKENSSSFDIDEFFEAALNKSYEEMQK